MAQDSMEVKRVRGIEEMTKLELRNLCIALGAENDKLAADLAAMTRTRDEYLLECYRARQPLSGLFVGDLLRTGGH